MSLIVNGSCVEPRIAPASQSDDRIIRQAIALLEQRIFKKGPFLDGPTAVKDYLRLKLVAEPNEIFAVVFLNNKHEVLAYEPMFKGTIHSATVHARPIMQRALELNAAAVIFSHQHPSGCTEPSSADCAITQTLKTALALIDVRVLDHLIVGQGTPYSFAESDML
ncbi:MAG: DNA repair protein RadC [Lysobacterales bacterium 13-68-4]|jgi:DNA repair protein RadC|uniref:JAB domain-containing protein n=1 Tax=Pseudomonadota TaxID=1224 RepID=UPI000BC918AE|nr:MULTISPECIES: JAB domain-containing protein [Pseudomonadota]MCH1909067.1 DNA repair protein RadC [Stenotrophomonas sp. Y6]MCW0203695.1 DNA repair protein RadC [Rhodanobacter thiooxydans]OZB66948.1 MAG: DNA repair protein RadC [Xanthomonadales bacterium 13-68-4]